MCFLTLPHSPFFYYYLGSHYACAVDDDGTAQSVTTCGPSDVYTNCELLYFPSHLLVTLFRIAFVVR